MREIQILQQIYGNFVKKCRIKGGKNWQAIEMPRFLK
jgi:hypothetical protein